MLINRHTVRFLLLVLCCFTGITPAFSAESTVNVALWDSGASSMNDLGSTKPLGMAMSDADMKQATMGVKVNTSSVPAGKVTFDVTNTSDVMIHEMVLAPVADKTTPMPYSQKTQKVDEDAAGHLGEVAELEPGGSGALTLTLKPGTYILYCNIPGHYVLGMWTLLEVKAD